MSLADKLKVPVDELCPVIAPEGLGFSDTSQLGALDEPIGQQRAVDALEFGLRMPSAGFNIFVAGPVGAGKWSLVKSMVGRIARQGSAPSDWCYVNNFHDTSRPCCLAFPAGRGPAFKDAMAALIDSLRRDLPKAFESRLYMEARAKIAEDADNRKKDLFRNLTETGIARGFGFQETPTGFTLVALRNGNPMTDEEIAALTDAEREQMAEREKSMESEVREFHVNIHAVEREAESRLREIDRQVVTSLLVGRFETLRREYGMSPDVAEYLTMVHDDIVAHYRDLMPKPPTPFPFQIDTGREHDLSRYHVNLIVQHIGEGVPVIVEPHPTYTNLIGKIERRGHLGVVYSDFTDIKAGAVLQANGGYLILSALDVLKQPFAWEAVKQVIKTGAVTIEDPGEFLGFSTIGLRPQPVPVRVKVILVGPPLIYHLLQAYEEDFAKLFKVKADFDVDVPRTASQEQRFAQLVGQICREEHLPHFEAAAVASLLTYAVRLAERHDRLSLRLSLVADTVREAAYWAQQDHHPLVTAADVERALTQKRHRLDLPEQWIQDAIKEGSLLVDFEGEKTGQVNGLSVHLMGDYAFGRPCRITARTFVGTKGVIDIQREAEMSGHVHSKGVLTLAGYLAGKFAGAQPLALTATLTFEQTYSEVEGDSAAVAELVAILSSLAGAPVRQGLAITGSMNQLGEVQPIGGVNEKVEGFFASCRDRGFTGGQGVIIPARNVKSLALRPEVVAAVRTGDFQLYSVHTVEEAVELLTGVPAGTREADGRYPATSIFGRVQARLAEMAAVLRHTMQPERPNDTLPAERK